MGHNFQAPPYKDSSSYDARPAKRLCIYVWALYINGVLSYLIINNNNNYNKNL